jgi:hypothetical protein
LSWFGLGPERLQLGNVNVIFHGAVLLHISLPVKDRMGYYYIMGECYADLLLNEGAYSMVEERGVEERVTHGALCSAT